MKLLRYGQPGQERAGLLDADGRIRALPETLGDLTGDRLSPAGLADIAALDPESLPVVEGNPRLGSCIARPGKFVCIGLNYRDHAAESNLPIPAEPVIFGKWSSAIVGPNDDVEIPRGSEKTDWEVELGVVIGTRARYVEKDAALTHVAGYCVVHDVSERAYQLERGGTWDKGKGCDTFGPTGPWLVTADEVGDPQNLRLWLEVDGHRHQNGNTSDMIFTVAEIVSYVSQFCTLEPGDIITTGTPKGVGMGYKPPVFLRAGQTVRLGIDKLGEQQQRFVAAA
ncbi:fumarylacetoacetate (FAA) hydrolase family protein [Sphingomonas sp. S17]|uniref:Fumarylacetoacetate hydrolase family protein n=2 Tax=Sphingomonas paucimobilis TaxID=13689 RepID=A0A411LMY8_SPHPI|nr:MULTISPECIES: fumarylacetoacetate hydrolase family protein [Sphingomonas]EGI55807.1 fumarylacetoacetate (FAA) hydrolase family protein [Sphingomonas sp. S17]MBQ1478528.1 fumarylacetoacetate hydrolase family protein [Sphingomonas sp.]MCM3679626.1 fumarylacetoacetate hydrolase family protein [Sphingomonas paucimobilis]MDG5970980.1 fumarylacetoacetate hydrolase family protein [Sphingomonas paucimobilis]NNG58468.1 fumarylacetoacetate hydrolase family protein [Sphingomonas paucimobilis]